MALVATACGGTTTGTAPPAATSPGGTSPAATGPQETQTGGATADCGPGDATLSVLHIWAGADSKGPPFQDGLAGFKEQCPNITIEEQTAPDPETQQTQYETAKLAGNEPDIVITNLFGKSTSWLENGATIDVAPYIDEWGLRDLIDPLAIQQWSTPEGQVQAFPFEGFTWPVWYNTRILEEAGVAEIPTTMDDLIAAAEQIRAAGLQPLTIGGSDWTGNKLYSLTLETVMTDEELIDVYTNGSWDDPKVRTGTELFTRLRDANVFSDSAEGLSADDMYAQFYNAEAAIMHAGSWAYADMPEEELSNVELGGYPLPADSVREKPIMYTSFTATSFWISPNGAEKLDAVRPFITWFYRPEVLGGFVEVGVVAPVPFDQVEADEGSLHPLYVQAVTEVSDVTTTALLPDPYVPAASQTAFERATSLAYSPGTSVDAIIQALQEAWQQ